MPPKRPKLDDPHYPAILNAVMKKIFLSEDGTLALESMARSALNFPEPHRSGACMLVTRVLLETLQDPPTEVSNV